MNRSKQAGMGKKTIVVLLIGLILAFVRLAEAQQRATVPKIGWLGAGLASEKTREIFRRELRAWLCRRQKHSFRVSIRGS
jgi:hypothetical protein